MLHAVIMSSPDLESSFSTYSFPHELPLSSSPTSSEVRYLPRDTPQEPRIPPRLRSPDLFREIFGTTRNGQTGGYAADLNQSPINYQETMNDVNRALQSANRAIQSAQEAFQSRRSASGNNSSAPEVVDLTGASPPLNTSNLPTDAVPAITSNDPAYDEFLSRFTHPDESSLGSSGVYTIHSEPLYGQGTSFTDEFSSNYIGPDSLAGPRRRFNSQRRPHLGIPNMQRDLISSSGRQSNSRDETAAIRRQHLARAQWEDNQRRAAERHRLEEQRLRLLNSPAHARNVHTLHGDRQNPASTPSRSSSPSSSASIEAVDLTQVEDDPSLAAALSKQRQDAIASQNPSSTNMPSNSGLGSGAGRTALTAYKCPICMEPPQNATTTSCGHLFCHKCIIDTLKWSEQARRDEVPPSRKVKGVCPVCRKELARKEEPGNGRTLIPLEIKLITKKELKRKRKKEEQQKRAANKGKQKVYDMPLDDENELFDLNYHETASNKHINTNPKLEDASQTGGSSQKENRDVKKIKTSQGDTTEMDSLFDFDLDESSW